MSPTLPPPLFGAADGFDGDGYDAGGYDRAGYDADDCNADGYDRDGNPKNAEASELDLGDLWAKFTSTPLMFSQRLQHTQFRQYLRQVTRDPETIDSVAFCIKCSVPGWNDEMPTARGNDDTQVCEPCASAWSDCDSCDDLYPDGELTSTLGDRNICNCCRTDRYSYCDSCEGYYPDDEADEHDHGGYDDCCTSPQPAFAVRNDGCEPLANDTRATIALPAGDISSEGLGAISAYLRRQFLYDLSRDLEPVGDQWQTMEGNFTKRLSRHAFKAHGDKLSPQILSQVGCIARDHSQPVSVAVEVTRELNQSAADFYHEDSCWWNSYRESRCALKTNGGFGLRTFGPYDNVSGRAWVMPLRSSGSRGLVPTFDTLTPDAFVVFNGYGDLSGYAAPRIMAHLAGWTYRKIEFGCEPMYVNAGGYLVAPEVITEQYASTQLVLRVRKHSSLFSTEQKATAKETSS